MHIASYMKWNVTIEILRNDINAVATISYVYWVPENLNNYKGSIY